jgi:hypothetical protein
MNDCLINQSSEQYGNYSSNLPLKAQLLAHVSLDLWLIPQLLAHVSLGLSLLAQLLARVSLGPLLVAQLLAHVTWPLAHGTITRKTDPATLEQFWTSVCLKRDRAYV